MRNFTEVVEVERPSGVMEKSVKFSWESLEKYDRLMGDTEESDGREKAGNEFYRLERCEMISTYEERLKQTPAEVSGRGEWSGERGESDYMPSDKEIKGILDKSGKESITYQDAIPDFSDLSEVIVEIDNMSEDRAENFRQCDEICAEQWGIVGKDGKTDWTARDVKEWRQGNDYSWHERNDMRTCDLIPTQVNAYFGHLGGVSECKKRDAVNGGMDFDE